MLRANSQRVAFLHPGCRASRPGSAIEVSCVPVDVICGHSQFGSANVLMRARELYEFA